MFGTSCGLAFIGLIGVVSSYDAAAYNKWYWLSWVVMVPVPFVLGCGVEKARLTPTIKQALHVIVVLACIACCFEFTANSIFLKWKLRADAAIAENPDTKTVPHNAANIAFIPVFGFGAALLSTAVWYLGRRIALTNYAATRTDVNNDDRAN